MTTETKSVADQISGMETELYHLRVKSDADDQTIDLLKNQVANLNNDAERSRRDYDNEIRKLRQERDEALSKVSQVKGIIESICKLGLEGVNRLLMRPLTQDSTVKDMVDHIPPKPILDPNRVVPPKVEYQTSAIRPAPNGTSAITVRPIEDAILGDKEEDPPPLFIRGPLDPKRLRSV